MSAALGRPSLPNILYLTHRVPYPPDKGDRIRSFHLLRFLARHASVHLASLADEPVAEKTLEMLGRYTTRLTVRRVGWWRWGRALGSLLRGRPITSGAFDASRLRADLQAWCVETKFHATLSSSSAMAAYQRLADLREVPAIVDMMDVDSQKWYDYARASRWPRSWLYRLEGSRLRRVERDFTNWTRAVTVVTEAEADLYRSFAAEAPVHAVGNGVDLDYFRPESREEEPACVFVGALDYRPNIDAACWFCREVLPSVRRIRPEARVYLVGRRPAAAVRALAELPGVELIGQVPDVRPHLARAAMAVVPLHIARGVQNKVLEALAMAKATVATPMTLAGLRGQATPGVLMASTVADWTSAVLHLLDDEPLRRRLGAAGRRYVAEHHCWDRCLEPFLDLLRLRNISERPPIAVNPAASVSP
jgi:sugar transferase (PEP-CTERM/EpsH1 system associated)